MKKPVPSTVTGAPVDRSATPYPRHQPNYQERAGEMTTKVCPACGTVDNSNSAYCLEPACGARLLAGASDTGAGPARRPAGEPSAVPDDPPATGVSSVGRTGNSASGGSGAGRIGNPTGDGPGRDPAGDAAAGPVDRAAGSTATGVSRTLPAAAATGGTPDPETASAGSGDSSRFSGGLVVGAAVLVVVAVAVAGWLGAAPSPPERDIAAPPSAALPLPAVPLPPPGATPLPSLTPPAGSTPTTVRTTPPRARPPARTTPVRTTRPPTATRRPTPTQAQVQPYVTASSAPFCDGGSFRLGVTAQLHNGSRATEAWLRMLFSSDTWAGSPMSGGPTRFTEYDTGLVDGPPTQRWYVVIVLPDGREIKSATKTSTNPC
ncbi:hypothetical protein GCM10022225_64170 [Plantactinospora mayteni]|uniref:Zinc ribbon domain-containing protein n=1 Tax=Plantactinospora mayteni TaxID=566021 RepID=A0ABQ4F0B7_9ACTN|nr:hypothetical protein [Plantactinospora mayteni]GIH00346.1 hypothetical protein Pma05_69180 [Plantactinospora mayteni]